MQHAMHHDKHTMDRGYAWAVWKLLLYIVSAGHTVNGHEKKLLGFHYLKQLV